jgi:hypothetical protein
MGMNTGMQDAFNFGWKMALVFHKRSPIELLESYSVERRFAGLRVVSSTDAATKGLTIKAPLLQAARNKAMQFASSFGVVFVAKLSKSFLRQFNPQWLIQHQCFKLITSAVAAKSLQILPQRALAAMPKLSQELDFRLRISPMALL